jgi:hypothetical protein
MLDGAPVLEAEGEDLRTAPTCGSARVRTSSVSR